MPSVKSSKALPAKNNAVDLIEKGWAEPVKSAPKKKADKPAGKEKS